jgi:hypothetical protein
MVNTSFSFLNILDIMAAAVRVLPRAADATPDVPWTAWASWTSPVVTAANARIPPDAAVALTIWSSIASP